MTDDPWEPKSYTPKNEVRRYAPLFGAGRRTDMPQPAPKPERNPFGIIAGVGGGLLIFVGMFGGSPGLFVFGVLLALVGLLINGITWASRKN